MLSVPLAGGLPPAMTALPPPYPDRRAIIDLIRQECSRPDTVIGGQRHAHQRPLIFHDPPDDDGGISHSPERAAAVLPRLIAVAARSSRLSAATTAAWPRRVRSSQQFSGIFSHCDRAP